MLLSLIGAMGVFLVSRSLADLKFSLFALVCADLSTKYSLLLVRYWTRTGGFLICNCWYYSYNCRIWPERNWRILW